jgi:hypothetical protein
MMCVDGSVKERQGIEYTLGEVYRRVYLQYTSEAGAEDGQFGEAAGARFRICRCAGESRKKLGTATHP